MAATFAFGIVLLRTLLGFGDGVYAAVALTGSSIGVAEILKEMVRGATVPKLGMSYHGNTVDEFQQTYASTIVLSIIAAVFSVFVLLLFILFLHKFQLPEHLMSATRYLIVTRMITTFVAIALSPIHNMMPITGRMAMYNFWLTVERSGEVAAALVAAWFISGSPDATKLVWFSTLSAMLMTSFSIAAAMWAMRGFSEFRPRLKFASSTTMRETFRLISWNGAAVGSVNLYLRFDVFAVNILYGVTQTVVFGLAAQLAAYVRILTMGLIAGLDAHVTRSSALGRSEARQAAFRLSQKIFELQSIVLFSAALVLALNSNIIISILFSDKISADVDLSLVSTVFLYLMAGMVARGLSEGWMSILAATGHIKEYALPVFLGALLNPILVLASTFFLGSNDGFYVVPVLFAILNIIFHLGVIPVVTARILEVRVLQLVKPCLVPLSVACLCLTTLSVAMPFIKNELPQLFTSVILTSILMGSLFLKSFRNLLISNE